MPCFKKGAWLCAKPVVFILGRTIVNMYLSQMAGRCKYATDYAWF